MNAPGARSSDLAPHGARVHGPEPTARGGLQDFFRRFAQTSSTLFGTPWAFLVAVLVILLWAGLGPIFHFSDTWQLVINTSTTIVTFLMVFIIQNTQNRDAKAIHLKLDELIRALEPARNRLLDLENMTDDELKRLEDEFRNLRDRARAARASGTAHEAVSPAHGRDKR